MAADQAREEYVESELRKRVVAASVADAEPPKGTAATTATGIVPPPPPQAESQRVMQGKLLEIDLGDEARARNIEMTERARRRLQGLGADAEETAPPRPTTTRLGPDGKPWRGRKRRGSEDIKRDQLVEEFLHENSRKFGFPSRCCAMRGLILSWQWASTMCRLSSGRRRSGSGTTRWRPTTASPRSFGASLWTPCRVVGGGRRHRRRRSPGRGRTRRCSRDRSWAGAGTRGRR